MTHERHPSIVEASRGPVRILTFTMPDKKNAFDLEARLALLTSLRSAESSSSAIVLTGADEFFSAGGDIRAMSDDPIEAGQRMDALSALAQQLVHSRVPIVAAAEGGAYGMGLSILCAATYAVAGRSARFEASFLKIGLAPDTGLSWLLPRRIGAPLARRMMLTLLTLEGESALRAGLVDEIVDDGAALDAAVAIAERLSSMSAPAVAGITGLFAGGSNSLEDALGAESQLQLDLLASPESKSLREAFRNRVPRRPRGTFTI